MLPVIHRGDYLRAVRCSLGFSTRKMAALIGKSDTAINQIEHNDHPGYTPTRDILIQHYQQHEAAQRETVAGFPAELFSQKRFDAFPPYTGKASERFARRSETKMIGF